MQTLHILNLAIDVTQVLTCILAALVTFYPD